MMEHQTEPKSTPQRLITNPEINKTIPWGVFDGASQGEPPLGGTGGVVYLNEEKKIEITCAHGRASNNKA